MSYAAFVERERVSFRSFFPALDLVLGVVF
jgi:hypothetical protein